MNLNAPEIQEKISEWETELRQMTGNYRVSLSAHVKPKDSGNLDSLIRIVCEETGIEIGQIRTKTRKREIVIARQLLVYYARMWFGLSYAELGGLIGGRDHTTAIHSRQSIQDLLDTKDEGICYLVSRITKRIEEQRITSHPNNSA